MTDHEYLELASLYALGILSEKERIAFEEHLLSGCESCRKELQEMRHVAGLFPQWPSDGISPRPEIRDLLMERIGAGPTERLEPAFPAAEDSAWTPSPFQGIFRKLISIDEEHHRATVLLRFMPGAEYPPHRHVDVEEAFIFDGELEVDGQFFPAGGYMRAEAGSIHHRVRSENGCTGLLIASTDDVLLTEV
jgi:anti-sigma factor ChrR (cupin superfamily)